MLLLKANGKFIDTLPLKGLIAQQECNADFVTIELDRYYRSLDLSKFQFVMRSVTESGAETQVILERTELSSVIHLLWRIDRSFTAESGKLLLELIGYRYLNTEVDYTQTLPDYVLRYQLPPIEVRGLIKGNHEPEESDSNNSVITMIQFKEALVNLQENMTTQVNQIQELQDRIKIIVLTQEEYDAIENPDENQQILYIIKN